MKQRLATMVKAYIIVAWDPDLGDVHGFLEGVGAENTLHSQTYAQSQWVQWHVDEAKPSIHST